MTQLADTPAAAAAPPPAPSAPGGVADSLMVWLDANDYDGDGDTTNNTAGDISTWHDISGNGNDFTALSGDEPTVVLDNLNGQDGLSFNGAGDYLTSGAISDLDNLNGLTVFIVYQRTGGFGNKRAFSIDTNQAPTTFSTVAAQFGSSSVISTTSGGSEVSANITAPYGSNVYVALIWNNSTDTVTGRANGVLGASNTGATANPVTHNNITIGSTTNGNLGVAGYFYEYIIYNRELTSQEITDVESYLATKYNL